MALPAELLPKVLAFVPTDLRCLSPLRVVSRDAKDRVEARWWKEQVRNMKHFVDRHAFLFSDHPELEEEQEHLTLEDRLTWIVSGQEAFARNVLVWVKPLLLKEPWRAGGAEEGGSETDAEPSKVTPQEAFGNLRRAMASLNWRQTELLRDIRQQARHIERNHLSQRRSSHTLVSLTDRRQIEGPTSAMLATLETTEMRSEDAVSDSLAHTEMTREPYANPAVMRLFSQQGISDEQGWEVLNSMVEQGIVPNAAVFLETFEHMSETESEYSDRADPSHLIETTPFSPQTRTPFLQERAADNDFQDRRHMEGHTVADELDTTEFGNEDATLDSFTHSEMTREPYTHPESTVQLSQQGSSDEQRLELLKIMLGVFRTNALVIPQPFQSMSQIGSTQLSEERLTVSEVMCNISEARARFWKAAWNGFFTLVHRQNTTAVGALNVVAAKKVQIVEKPLFAGIDKDAVEAGADKDAKTRAGETALHWAILNRHKMVTRELVLAGADKDAKTRAGETALHLAIRSSEDEDWPGTVSILLDAGANKEAQTPAGETALLLAAGLDHRRCVLKLLEAGAEKDAVTEDGHTLLHVAAKTGNIPLVCKLLEAGADKDAKTRAGETALHWAAKRTHTTNNILCLEKLLEAGAEKDAVTADGHTALHLAARLGNIIAVLCLLDAGVDKDAQTPAGKTALHFAAERRHHLCVLKLLQAGAEKDAVTADGHTALHLAARTSEFDSNAVCTLLTLLEAGADKDAKTRAGETALHLAIRSSGDEDWPGTVSILLDAGANKEAQTPAGETALLLAAGLDHRRCVLKLLEAGAEKDAVTEDGHTLLHVAAKTGNIPLVCKLLEAGADKDAKTRAGETALHLAAKRTHTTNNICLQKLLEAGAEKDAVTADGHTALHLAARLGNFIAVLYLLDAGVDKDAQTPAGKTALHFAAEEHHHGCVEKLLEAGAEKDAVTAGGHTALHLAAHTSEYDANAVCTFCTLLEAGADKDAKTRAGETALHLAAELDLHGCVKKLLKAGAEKDAVTADGQTALHLAARRGNWHSVRNLLEEGADRFAKTSAGETAFSLADKGGHSMVTWELNRADKVLSRRDMAAVHKTVMIFSMSWLTLRHVKARMRRQAADLRLRHDASPRPVLAREFSMVRSTTVLLLRNRIRQVLRRMH